MSVGEEVEGITTFDERKGPRNIHNSAETCNSVPA